MTGSSGEVSPSQSSFPRARLYKQSLWPCLNPGVFMHITPRTQEHTRSHSCHICGAPPVAMATQRKEQGWEDPFPAHPFHCPFISVLHPGFPPVANTSPPSPPWGCWGRVPGCSPPGLLGVGGDRCHPGGSDGAALRAGCARLPPGK